MVQFARFSWGVAMCLKPCACCCAAGDAPLVQAQSIEYALTLPVRVTLVHALRTPFLMLLWLILAISIPVGTAVQAQERPRDPVCAQWDDLAGEAIAYLVRGKDDLFLRQVGDAVFRMRRARRTCQLGWAQLACRDYRAIVQSVRGFSAAFPHHEPVCASATATITETTTEAPTRAESVTKPTDPGELTPMPTGCSQLFAAYPPIDEALGNTDGDPFAYLVFNREPDLATMREASERCFNRTFARAEQ